MKAGTWSWFLLPHLMHCSRHSRHSVRLSWICEMKNHVIFLSNQSHTISCQGASSLGYYPDHFYSWLPSYHKKVSYPIVFLLNDARLGEEMRNTVLLKKKTGKKRCLRFEMSSYYEPKRPDSKRTSSSIHASWSLPTLWLCFTSWFITKRVYSPVCIIL